MILRQNFQHNLKYLKVDLKQANFHIDSEYENQFNRLIILIQDDKPISPQNILETTGYNVYDNDSFNINQSLIGLSFKTGGPYTTLNIAKSSYNFYNVTDVKSKRTLLVIESQNKEDLDVFRQKAEVIRIAFAILMVDFMVILVVMFVLMIRLLKKLMVHGLK